MPWSPPERRAQRCDLIPYHSCPYPGLIRPRLVGPLHALLASCPRQRSPSAHSSCPPVWSSRHCPPATPSNDLGWARRYSPRFRARFVSARPPTSAVFHIHPRPPTPTSYLVASASLRQSLFDNPIRLWLTAQLRQSTSPSVGAPRPILVALLGYQSNPRLFGLNLVYTLIGRIRAVSTDRAGPSRSCSHSRPGPLVRPHALVARKG